MHGGTDTDEVARAHATRHVARAVAVLVGVAMLVTVALAIDHSTASADIIILDPPVTECDPSLFIGLPFNPCDAFTPDPNVDDPNNPCDGLIISGQRRNTPEVVVQYFNVPNPDPSAVGAVSGLPVCLMEQEVIAELAAERGVALNAAERAEILAFGRDEIRARLFARLINLQDRANNGETLTTTEQGALAWAQAIQINGNRAIADAALAEYEAWKAAPCDYVPPIPHQYNVSGDPGCAGGIAGLFTSVTPPTYHDFIAYGVTRMTDGHHGAAALAAAEMSVALQIGLAASTVGAGGLGALLTAGGVGAVFVPALKALVFPSALAVVKAKAAALAGSTAGAAGGAGGVGVAFLAAAIVVVVVLTIATIVRIVQLFEQAQIATQLQADVDAAQATSAALDAQSFVMLFADATVPVFDPPADVAASATPGPSSTDPFFTTEQEGTTTRGQTIVYRSGGKNYRAWLSDGWWVVEPIESPGQRTLEPSLLLLDDAGEVLGYVSYVDGQIIVLDAASGGSGSLFMAQAPPRSDPSDLTGPVVARFALATPPTVTPASSSVTVDEGGDVTISGVVAGATALQADLSDGSPIDVAIGTGNSFSFARRYTDDALFTAVLTPLDEIGAGVPAQVDVTVRNVAPTITGVSLTSRGAPIHPAGLRTGDPVTVSTTFTDPGFADTHLITIDWADGTQSGPQSSGTSSHFYDTAGTYPITVRVVDDDGGADEAVVDIVVVNYPNLVDVTGGSGFEGDGLAITGRIVGTDPATSFVRVGASTPRPTDYSVTSTGQFSVPVGLLDDTFTLIELTAFGEGNEGGTIGVDVVVQNVAPTITSVGVTDTGGQPGPFTVGETVRFAVDFTDPGILDTHTVGIDWGDGTTTTDVFEHTYAGSAASYTATVTVTDDDRGRDVRTVDVTFDVTPPTAVVDVAAGQASDANGPVVFVVTFDEPVTDVDSGDIEIVGVSGTVVVEPTSDPAVFRVIVTPTSDGPFTIRVDTTGVTDGHGNPGTASGAGAPTGPTVVFIADDPNPGVNDAPGVAAPTSIELEAATPKALPVVVTDPDSLDGELVVTVTFAAGSVSATGPAIVSGTATDELTVVGTLADVNATLAGLMVAADTTGAGVVTIAVDDQGNTGATPQSASAEVAVTVVDTTPPTISVPRVRVVARTDPGRPTATVVFEVTADDPGSEPTGTGGRFVDLNAAPVLSCVPESGSAFPIGSTTVTCTATDSAGNAASASFVVEVTDAEAPVITGAIDQTVQLGAGSSGPVTFAVPGAADNSGVVDLVCSPASGTTLLAGTNRVTCVATDPSGNQSTASFVVDVIAATPSATTNPPTTSTPAARPVGVLPTTGADGSVPLRIALLLVTAGLALTLIATRRRSGSLT